MRLRLASPTIALAIVVLLLGGAALAKTFGPEPTAVSAAHAGANGPSGSPAISGDNRKVRYVAFHSFASNLVRGDSNGKLDVFLWARATRKIVRASVTNRGKQANGASANPALDGSVQRAPRCVAFQSQATNLAAADRDSQWDIFV